MDSEQAGLIIETMQAMMEATRRPMANLAERMEVRGFKAPPIVEAWDALSTFAGYDPVFRVEDFTTFAPKMA